MDNLISICVPVYNSSMYISQTLDCLCAQDYKNIEIIVVNDGSTDNSVELINQTNDKRVKLITVNNGGAAKARNIAFNRSQGSYIIFFDADDYIPANFISSQNRKIKGLKEDIVFSGWGRFYNNDLETFQAERLRDYEMTFTDWVSCYWYYGNPMTNPGRAIIPRELIDKAGLWNEDLTLNDDFEFFTRLLLKSKNILFNGEALFYYRSGISGLSASTDDNAYRSYYESNELSVELVLNEIEQNDRLLKSCANIWQLFVYSAYPDQSKLVKKAEIEIKKLGGADLRFPAGRITRLISLLLGWKLARRIRISFGEK